MQPHSARQRYLLKSSKRDFDIKTICASPARSRAGPPSPTTETLFNSKSRNVTYTYLTSILHPLTKLLPIKCAIASSCEGFFVSVFKFYLIRESSFSWRWASKGFRNLAFNYPELLSRITPNHSRLQWEQDQVTNLFSWVFVSELHSYLLFVVAHLLNTIHSLVRVGMNPEHSVLNGS